jgi:hypothetical protein
MIDLQAAAVTGMVTELIGSSGEGRWKVGSKAIPAPSQTARQPAVRS